MLLNEWTDSLVVLISCFQGLSPTTAASAAAFRATHSSRRLQRTWRRFAAQRKTTTQLARTFAALGISSREHTEDDADTGMVAPAAGSVGSCEARTSIPGVVMIGGLGPGRPSPHHMRFEDFAAKLQSPATLRAAQVCVQGQLTLCNMKLCAQDCCSRHTCMTAVCTCNTMGGTSYVTSAHLLVIAGSAAASGAPSVCSWCDK